MNKLFIIIGAVSAGLTVVLGAFGAHALQETLTASGRLDTYETAVKYQMYHSLALILLGILMGTFDQKALLYSGYSLIIGIVIFSGSLYLLCATGLTKLGMITPIGGLFLIAAWILLALGVGRSL